MRHGLRWYWHRLRAMNWAEVGERLGQKRRQRADGRRPPDFQVVAVGEPAIGAWPGLPDRNTVPREVEDGLRQDAADLLAGRWLLFGHLRVQVDDPPRWFSDYAASRDLPTARPGFRLNHRELPAGADIKVLWEMSRWVHLVRLAQAGWVLGDACAVRKCVAWLDDWRRGNPPYLGWNWTSALESGLRLVNLAWLEALLQAGGAEGAALANLRQRLVPAHVWYTWRHRSFGTSANNHLLGELAGLIVATARWPSVSRWGAPLEELQRRWEEEVLSQFAGDGGNREQALNYQLFAWELCWAAQQALQAAGRSVSGEVETRLRRAADFLVAVQVPADAWDYGDSDSAIVTPLGRSMTDTAGEWYAWFSDPETSPALRWWLGDPPSPVDPAACQSPGGDWLVFDESGQAVNWSGDWLVRWDLSELGYLSMAAHGHLDALHCTVWLRGVALVVDPGTGAYYGDTRLRSWLASWPAHNGPHVPGVEFPRRLGPFLWGERHAKPTWKAIDAGALDAELALPQGTVRRLVRRFQNEDQDGWQIDDLVERTGEGGFRVTWQFAPGTRLEAEPGNPHLYHGERRGVRFTVGFDAAWSEVRLTPETRASLGFPVRGDLLGLCSSAFRRIEEGPVIVLGASGRNPARYRTTFLRA